ncbi:N-formylglutamate amidohydrolase [Streptomyces sp. NWU49]|uniref:golvesin C-terminal-like domain-containing protein n=1 Tax=Streptomyces sp. NWU49 TaxID=2201153 RepID=UPI00215B6D89|nr:N-formylglutamate amidohydrolase [Streptomyces sp. NWU49]
MESIRSGPRWRRLLALPVAALACVLAGAGLSPAADQEKEAEAFVPGTSYFDEKGYIEYVAGNLPVIFTAPHGGSLTPEAIPARSSATCGPKTVTQTDLNTQDLARQIQQAFFNKTGKYPHVVINRLARSRLDANRDIGAAACGNPSAEQAWRDYHGFIDAAKADVLAEFGRGWYTDLHGHGHAVQRLELGYQLTAETLRLSDAELDAAPAHEQAASFRTFSEESPLSFSALLRGPTALGTYLTDAGYPSVPSQQDPAPQVGEPYFTGADPGYNTPRHGCADGGRICGVQIETHYAGVRRTLTDRSDFATALADVYPDFLAQFGIRIEPKAKTPPTPGDEIVVDNLNSFNDPAKARFVTSGSWVDGNNSQSHGLNFRLLSNPSAKDTAEFRFYVPTPGSYAIDAWWPAQSGRSRNVVYQIHEADGSTALAESVRDQRVDGAQWNPFGVHHFSKAGWARVVVSQSPGATGSLAADAVRVTLTHLTPSEGVAVLAGLVGELPLDAGNARSLNAKLDAASAQFGRGNVEAGKGQLGAFINQVTAFKQAGSLSAEQARPVIEYAERVIRDAEQQTGQ